MSSPAIASELAEIESAIDTAALVYLTSESNYQRKLAEVRLAHLKAKRDELRDFQRGAGRGE